MSAYDLEKEVWSEANFKVMGWHDASLWSMVSNAEQFEYLFDLDYIDALVTTVNLSSDRWDEIQLLTILYEASLQDKEAAKFQYILAVSLMFRDDIRLTDIYKNDFGLSTGTYSTNNAVIESLKKHGFTECANLEGADLVHCNLDVLENYPYKRIKSPLKSATGTR